MSTTRSDAGDIVDSLFEPFKPLLPEDDIIFMSFAKNNDENHSTHRSCDNPVKPGNDLLYADKNLANTSQNNSICIPVCPIKDQSNHLQEATYLNLNPDLFCDTKDLEKKISENTSKKRPLNEPDPKIIEKRLRNKLATRRHRQDQKDRMEALENENKLLKDQLKANELEMKRLGEVASYWKKIAMSVISPPSSLPQPLANQLPIHPQTPLPQTTIPYRDPSQNLLFFNNVGQITQTTGEKLQKQVPYNKPFSNG